LLCSTQPEMGVSMLSAAPAAQRRCTACWLAVVCVVSTPVGGRRCKIKAWHLAFSRVTPRAAELLAACPSLVLVDLRGSGVRAGQLMPLRTRHVLCAPQGGVLSASAALALAAVTMDQFVCGWPEHGAAAFAALEDPEGAQAWVNHGAQRLLDAAAEAAAAALRAGVGGQRESAA
jgi:hypothetical protein